MTLKSVSLLPVHNSSCPDALLNPWNDGSPVPVSEKCFVCVGASLIPVLFLQEELQLIKTQLPGIQNASSSPRMDVSHLFCIWIFVFAQPSKWPVLLHGFFFFFWNQITFYTFTKIPVELTEHDAFIFLDFVVREKASMNNSKIMLRLLRFSTGEVITVGRMS